MKPMSISDPAPRRKELLTAELRFLLLTAGVFVFYLLYAWLQEALTREWKREGIVLGWYLTLGQFIIYSVLGGGYLSAATSIKRQVPLSQFAIIGALSVATMGLSNTACEFLTYPVQVLFKSSKLIPVMVVGIFMLGKRYSLLDYVAVVLLTLGLAVFSLADKAVSPEFNPVGVLLISSALAADAVIGNMQERVYGRYRCDPLEMVVWSKVVGVAYLAVIATGMGQLSSGLAYTFAHPETALRMAAFSTFGLLGEICVMSLVRHHGALVAVTVTSCRKAFSIVLSFLLFPKPFTPAYLVGGLVFTLGVALNIYRKNQKKLDAVMAGMCGIGGGAAAAKPSTPEAGADNV